MQRSTNPRSSKASGNAPVAFSTGNYILDHYLQSMGAQFDNGIYHQCLERPFDAGSLTSVSEVPFAVDVCKAGPSLALGPITFSASILAQPSYLSHPSYPLSLGLQPPRPAFAQGPGLSDHSPPIAPPQPSVRPSELSHPRPPKPCEKETLESIMDMWMSKRTREEKDAVLKQVELMEQHRRDLYMHALNKVKFPGDMAEKIWKRTFEVRRQKRSRNLKMREERLGRSVVRERGARGKRRISPLRNEIGMDCDEVEVEAPKTAWKWQGLMRRWVVNAMRGDSDP